MLFQTTCTPSPHIDSPEHKVLLVNYCDHERATMEMCVKQNKTKKRASHKQTDKYGTKLTNIYYTNK